MKVYYFKTNVNCGGCLKKVAPFLNDEKGINTWEIDLMAQDRVLTVKTDHLSSQAIVETIQKSGFSAQLLKMD